MHDDLHHPVAVKCRGHAVEYAMDQVIFPSFLNTSSTLSFKTCLTSSAVCNSKRIATLRIARSSLLNLPITSGYSLYTRPFRNGFISTYLHKKYNDQCPLQSKRQRSQPGSV